MKLIKNPNELVPNQIIIVNISHFLFSIDYKIIFK